METSKKLGKIIGLYMFIIGTIILCRMDMFRDITKSLIEDKSLMFVT